MDERKIGFLGGGNMASALIAGLLEGGSVAASYIRCAEPNSERRQKLGERFGITAVENNAELVDWADCVVLAVKPQVAQSALLPARSKFGPDKLLVSICAGVTIDSVAQWCGSGVRILRAMPNTPALAGRGATALARGATASDDDVRFVTSMFERVGKCWQVSENQLDAVTGLSGSGPAYVFLFIEALADGGVRSGLPREVSMQLAIQTVLGAAQLAAQSGTHPGALKDSVTSPAGTTIEGVFALERAGFRHGVMDAVCSATARSAALGARKTSTDS